MKRLLFVVAFAPLISCSVNEPNDETFDYYWYENTKITLQRGNQEYIIYDDAFLPESDKEQLVESGEVYYPEVSNLKWGITKPDAVIEDLEHVLYRTPSYKNNDGDNVFVTHRFYVKLKDNNDFLSLQEMVNKYNADIEQEDEDLPQWYILRCELPSSLNALELANIFYESGLFAASEPEFMGPIYPDIDDTAIDKVTNNPLETTKKMLQNGIIVIESGGKIYNVQGAEIR